MVLLLAQNKIKKANSKKMASPVFQSHKQQLLQYFSSYLTDTVESIQSIKRLVYELIEVELPTYQGKVVGADIFEIMAACKKSYDDLKRTECIMRGHVKAKRGSRFRSISQPEVYRKRESRFSHRVKQSCITPGYHQQSEGRPFLETPILTRNKIETKTTLKTQPTDSSRKQPLKMNLNVEEISFQAQQSDSINKVNTFDVKSSSNGSKLSRVRSLQILHKFQTIKQTRITHLNDFSKNNEYCLGLIKKLKVDIKGVGLKKKKVRKQ